MMMATKTLTARHPYSANTRPLRFAHRGGSHLAPENTLAAFTLGARYGANALETDIQLTRDGEVVTIHDATVDRTTDGTGLVASSTLAELRRLDAGFRFTPDGGATYPMRGQGISIPTLAEVFAAFPTLRINIDLKAEIPCASGGCGRSFSRPARWSARWSPAEIMPPLRASAA
jgi:glycerophosphoryl diester phosphodiesterase